MSALRENPSSMIRIGPETFEQIESFIADNEYSVIKANIGIDLLARSMVLVIKGNAQQRSLGPVAAGRRSNPAMANRIPVQRISGNYFAGWTQKRLGQGHWLVYNDAREAYLIETGMFQRVRRPILKMSMLDMLKMLQTTRTGDRFASWVMAPRRNSKGQFQAFDTRLMGTATIGAGMLAGPTGNLP